MPIGNLILQGAYRQAGGVNKLAVRGATLGIPPKTRQGGAERVEFSVQSVKTSFRMVPKMISHNARMVRVQPKTVQVTLWKSRSRLSTPVYL